MANLFDVTVNLMDESFSHQDTGNYGLAVILHELSVSWCVLDFRRNKFLGLICCERTSKSPSEGQPDDSVAARYFFSDVCEAFPWLLNTFKLVKVAYAGQKTTLIPADLFNPDDKDLYFKFNFTQEKDTIVAYDHLIPVNAYQVYAVPAMIARSAAEVFPAARLVHASGFLIEGVWINYKNRITSPHVFLQVRISVMDIMIFDGKQMIYFNTFPYHNAEEVAYYLIFVLEQLDYNPEMVPVVLMGNIEANAGLADLLHRYVRHVETVRKNEAYGYSYVMNHLQMHAFFPLLNTFSCGL